MLLDEEVIKVVYQVMINHALKPELMQVGIWFAEKKDEAVTCFILCRPRARWCGNATRERSSRQWWRSVKCSGGCGQ